MAMLETIGKVTLDLTDYPQEDFYCDGASEDALLDIVKTGAADTYENAIKEAASWEILYHLSPLRGNIVEWLSITKEMKVLEVGSGCGAITGTLAKKAGEVTCVELSKKRSQINAYRNRDCDNVTIKVGNFQDIEPKLPQYDYIILIGVLEYAGLYIKSTQPYQEFLTILRKHLAPEGKIIVAIENRLGMKYFAGCKEDHFGDYFSGIENYPAFGPAKTFSRSGLEKILNNAEITNYSFYYPYPDYKFMHTLYSDDRLPRRGELSTNIRNFDRDRMMLFDEKKAFDGVIEEGIFPTFSNSYLLIIGAPEDVVYAKYSNDRKPSCNLKTVLTRVGEATEKGCYYKLPTEEAGKKQVEKILHAYQLLAHRYSDSELTICQAKETEEGICFPVIEGRTLEEILDEALAKNDMETFDKLILKFKELCEYHKEEQATNYDFIFANIIVQEDGSWTVIDYEWTEEESTDSAEILKRAAYVYLQDGRRAGQLSFEQLLEKWDIPPVPVLQQYEAEVAFQKKVQGDHITLPDFRLIIDNAIYQREELLGNAEKKTFQVYLDHGNGLSEEDSYFFAPRLRKGEDGKEYNHVEITVSADVKSIRLDPLSKACILYLKELHILSEKGMTRTISYDKLQTNGEIHENGEILFAHDDPNITVTFDDEDQGHNIVFDYSAYEVPVMVAERLKQDGKEKKFFRKK